jgi:hypothetical protein
MSWNGTLRCSYCYEDGHSKRKCPTMKEQHDKYESATFEERRDMSYRYGNAHREYKAMQETLKESNKVCSYCQESGHRVLTCPDRLGHVELLRKINKAWKPLVAKVFKETGFGLGALINQQVWVTRDGKEERAMVPFVITGIEDGAVDFICLREGFGRVSVMDTTNMRQHWIHIPSDVQYALFKAVVDVEGIEIPADRWSNEWRRHPWSNAGVRKYAAPIDGRHCIMAPSGKRFHNHDKLFHPLEKKRDINKMFRSGKGKYYTEEYSGIWLDRILDLLKTHRGWKL